MARRKRKWALSFGWVAVPLAALAAGLYFKAPAGVAARSPINGLSLANAQGEQSYSFTLTGHVYGEKTKSVFPAASLLANIDFFNREDIRFVVLLGDIIQNMNGVEVAAFKKSFGQQVRKPIFNAIGNHDNQDRARYLKNFGPDSYYSFQYASELFVFMDGEERNAKIEGEQLEFLLGEIRRAAEDDGIQNVFFFSHRLLWAIGNPP
jgi:hypothetical protein